MRYLAALLGLLLSTQAHAIHIVSPAAKIDINTNKVIAIVGEIDAGMAASVYVQGSTNYKLPGDRVVLIDSPGGSVKAGMVIIQMLKLEKVGGTRIVCVVLNNATSMAFDILSQCDVRLAVPKSHSLVHKMAIMPSGDDGEERLTAKNMRRIADEMDKDEEPFRQLNAKLMGLTLKQYDDAADKETTWTAEKLTEMGYFQGLCTVGG